jgi:hypothetical protein
MMSDEEKIKSTLADMKPAQESALNAFRDVDAQLLNAVEAALQDSAKAIEQARLSECSRVSCPFSTQRMCSQYIL